MPTQRQQIQSEITGLERAIRHLIGEDKALKSKLARSEARLKLERTKLAAMTHTVPAVGHGQHFPDVSAYQPTVDWPALRKGATFGQLAFTKISEGGGYRDRLGALRLQQMTAAGVVHRGGYHFGHPGVSGIAQAQHFLNSGASLLTKDDIACYDCEVSDGQSATAVARTAKDFATELAKHSPAKRWLYGGGPFLREFGVTLDGFDGHWLAAYVTNPVPYMIFGKQRTVAWQFTDGSYGPNPHTCPGIGRCDISIYY